MAPQKKNLMVVMSEQGKAIKIFLGILAGVILVIALAMYFTHGIADSGREELDAIRSEDLNHAYALTSKAFQETTNFDQFKMFVDKYPILKDFTDVTFYERKVNNDMGYLSGTITGANGAKKTIQLELVKEDGKWKVQVIQLSDAGIKTEELANNQPSQPTVYDILVNDKAREDGYVLEGKTTIPKTAEKIFATVRIVGANGEGRVQAKLIQADGNEIGPISGEMTKSGNIMKAFSFTRNDGNWPVGKYTVVINMPSGENKTISFTVN